MPSPFPGMNPYIEQSGVWKDFHESFIPLAREVLAPQVAPNYFVKVEEHVYLHERSADERRPLGAPDVSIHRRPKATDSTTGTNTTAVIAPSHVFTPQAVEEEAFCYLEVIDRHSRRVVTVIELLSPSNKKTGEARDQYWYKTRHLLNTDTAVVEIDLLRGGHRMPWVDMPTCDYYALVSRVHERPRSDFWPVGLRDPLPIIPIPLRQGEPEASLDLQSLVHRVYDAAQYHLHIYDSPPEPSLRPEDQAWAESLIRTPS